MAPKLVKHIKSQRHYLLVETGRFSEKETPLMVIYYPLYECAEHSFKTPWIRLYEDHESAYEVARRNGGPRFCEVKPNELSTQEREVLKELLLKLRDDLDLAESYYLEPEIILTEFIPIGQPKNEIPPVGLQAEDITPYLYFLEQKGFAVSRMNEDTLYIWDKLKTKLTWERKYIIQADIQKIRGLLRVNFNRPQVLIKKLYYKPIYHDPHVCHEEAAPKRRYEEIPRKGCHDDIHIRGGHRKSHKHPEHWQHSETDWRHCDPDAYSEHKHNHLWVDQDLADYDHSNDNMGHHSNRNCHTQEQMPWE